MRVIKRSGRTENMKFDNVTSRIKNLSNGLSVNCDSSKVAQQVFSSMYDQITAQEIDVLSAETCIGMITIDPDYEILATRITASNIQKVCPNNFHLAMRKLQKAGVITDEVVDVADPIQILDTLFGGGAPLPEPSLGNCSPDPTVGTLTCIQGACP